jgi:tryptophan-rich sensory protein
MTTVLAMFDKRATTLLIPYLKWLDRPVAAFGLITSHVLFGIL